MAQDGNGEDGASVNRNRLVNITLDDATLARSSPDVDHERKVAIFDLLEENDFALPGKDGGPYHLHLSIVEKRLVFDLNEERNGERSTIILSLSPFRRIVRDYFMICESYFDAIKGATPSRIEAIDMARRGLHDEGSHALRDILGDKVEIDHGTARRLFTLICVLHLRG